MKFLALDFETANRRMDSVCEIGIAKYSNYKLIDEYSYLIKPKINKFDWFNTKLHGISEETVENKPEFDIIYDKVKNDLEEFPVFAHNASFDIRVLINCLNLYELDYPNLSYGCSYKLSKQHYPNQLSYKLSSLCKLNSIKLENHHRALADAKACGDLINLISKDLKLDNIEELETKYNFRFGKIIKGAIPSFSKRFELNKVDSSKADKSGVFFGKNIIFTGTLQSMARKEAQNIIAQKGGFSASVVNKKTNFLILGEQNYAVFGEGYKSAKIKKAEKLLGEGQEIEMLTESQFLELI